MFTDGLSAMSPANYAITPTGLISSVDNSFYSQATPGGTTQAPYWCGPATGEQILSNVNLMERGMCLRERGVCVCERCVCVRGRISFANEISERKII